MNPNPSPKLNEAQSQAVTAPGSVAVIAGAGTGKTTVLGERYLFHLQQYSPLQILALTYTDAAAAELRQRVMQRVRSEHPDSPRLLAEIQAAPILTFHAFCQKIILENPIEAGLPANFTLLETVQDPTWLPGQIERAMAQLDPADLRHFGVRLLKKVVAEYSQDPLGVLEALQIDLNELEERFNRERGDQLEIARKILAELNAIELIERKGFDEFYQLAIPALECLEHDPEQARELVNQIDFRKGKKDARVKALMKEFQRYLDKAHPDTSLIYLQWGSNRQDLTILRRVVEKVDQQLRQTKVEWGRLEFADLERHALEALENLDVQKRYRERYPVCLVDEFQDTNPVQVRLLRLLNPEKLTIVGDPQQSIYSFRRANPRLLNEMALEIVQGGGFEVTLSITHRYHQRIAQYIDPLFKRLWDEYEGMQTRRDPPVPQLEKYVNSQENPGNASESRKLQAQEVVGRIRELQQDSIQVYEKGQLLPVEYRHIAVLSRTWAPLQELAEILEREGIPVTQPAEGSLLDTPVGQDAQALLAFLDNPRDDLSLVTVLRSPFFALTDAQIVSLARREEKIPRVWEVLQNRGEFAEVYQILQQLRDQASRQPAVRLLRLADRLTGYSAVLAGIGVQNNGLTRDLADWRGLLQWVMEQPMSHSGAVARRMDQLKQAKLRVPRPPMEGGDAVTLSTIHSAKGLEWPVVFLFDLSRKAPSYSPRVIFSPEWGLAIKHERLLESLYRVIELRRKQEQEEEEKRLLYVAMTRARDFLYLLGGKSEGLWKLVMQASPDRLPMQETVVNDPED
jgi:ATP-dependent helicase/nuclease subunit A